MFKGNKNKHRTSKSKSIFWWEPSSTKPSLPIEFCNNTSLHGLRYIGQAQRNLIERLFWLTAFFIGIIVAVVLISGVWTKYRSHPIITTFDSNAASVHQIPFPAITICNVNSIRKDKAMEIIQEGYSGKLESLAKVSLLNHICTENAISFSEKFGYIGNATQIPTDLLNTIQELNIDEEDVLQITTEEFLQQNSQRCRNMILLCLWENKVQDCRELFQPVETEFGRCCTFNMVPRSLLLTFQSDERDTTERLEEWEKAKLNADEQWLTAEQLVDLDWNTYKYPRRSYKAGQINGLSVLINPGFDNWFCASSEFAGVKFAAHQTTASPNVAELGSAIRSTSEIFVSISPDIVNAEPSLKTYDMNTRNCYFDGEFELKYYKYYTQTSCVNECVANKTFDTCGCVRYYMPRDPDVQNLCGLKGAKCAEHIAKIGIHGPGQNDACINKCLPTCNEISYDIEVHNAPLHTDVEIWVNENGTKENWTDLQVSIAHFYFDHDKIYPKVKKELFGFTDLIASTGGILGICLGFSALSLLEIIYFVSLRLIFIIIRGRRRVTMTDDEKFEAQPQSPQLYHQQQQILPLSVQNLKNKIKKELQNEPNILYPNFFYHEMMPAGLRGSIMDAYK